MSLGPEPDLAWMAARYALGELSAVESSAFESLMADDQAAREALAEAVDLLGAIATVAAESSLSHPRRRLRRRAAWSAFLTAACVLAVAFLANRGGHPSVTEATEVVRAWSDLRSVPDAESPTLAEVHAPAGGHEPESIELESSADRPLPSWLLTAASAPQAGPVVEEN